MNKSIYWLGVLVYIYAQFVVGFAGALAVSLAQVTQYTLPSWAHLIFMFAIGSLWGLSHVAVIGIFVNE